MSSDSTPYLADSDSWRFSLSKFVGKKVVDVIGYPSTPFDENTPVFKICQIVFEDGVTLWVEGEHDTPYLPVDEKLQNMDEETLLRFASDEE